MSTKKDKRIGFRVSDEDEDRLKQIANKWESTEGYVMRRALKLLFEKEFQGNMNCEEIK